MNDPVTLLPANLGGLARIAGDATTRSAMTGVCVTLTEGLYEVAATNGKALAVVSGTGADLPELFPDELAELPPSTEKAVIPKQAWKEAFSSTGKPKGDPVAVHLGEQSSVLAWISYGEAHMHRTDNLEGRYPDYKSVLAIGAKQPVARVRLDPALVLDIVRLAQGVNKDCITLEVFGLNDSLVLRANNEEQQFLSLVMPITS
jgi:hypothetical protein